MTPSECHQGDTQLKPLLVCIGSNSQLFKTWIFPSFSSALPTFFLSTSLIPFSFCCLLAANVQLSVYIWCVFACDTSTLTAIVLHCHLIGLVCENTKQIHVNFPLSSDKNHLDICRKTCQHTEQLHSSESACDASANKH